MSKSNAVTTLLATAIALASTVENDELKTAIDALDALEDATHSNGEYKTLKEIVEKIESETQGAGDIGDADADAKAQLEAQKQEAPKKKNAMRYAGVKMIGGKWYCKKDNYKTGFATADECADHHNK